MGRWTSNERSLGYQNKQKTLIRKTKDSIGGCRGSRQQKYKRGLGFLMTHMIERSGEIL